MHALGTITVTEIIEAITISSPKGRYEEINNRNCYGISFCREGQITYTLDGKKFVSDKDHAIILPQGRSYSLTGDKTGIFPVINFRCVEKLTDTFLVPDINDSENYIKDFALIQKLSFFEGNRAKIFSIFYDILYRLESENSAVSSIAPAIKYIEENYKKPHLSNGELAAECGISEVYFRKLFLKHYKTTPKQFIMDVRLSRAKQLLCEGALKIGTISEESGFANPYHFCRVFKERCGLTPTDYMKKNKIYKI